MFLDHYQQGNEFFNHIVTGDKTWLANTTPDSEQKSLSVDMQILQNRKI